MNNSNEPIHTLPHNTDAEASLLGSLLLGGANVANVFDKLKPLDFYTSRHRIIFEQVQSLYSAEGVTDTVILISRLENSGLLDKVGGEEYVIKLTSRVRTSSNVLEYATIIDQAAKRRRLIETCQDIESRSRSGSGNIHELIDDAGAKFLNMGEVGPEAGAHSIQESLDEGFRLLDMWEKGEIGNVRSGFTDLDEMTNGFHPQDLVIIGARPAMGKTTLAMNIALNVARGENAKPVLFFSLETGHDQIALNMLSAESGVEATKMRKGQVNKSDYSALIQASDRIKGGSKIIIDDAPGLTAMAIRARARRHHQRHNLGMIVVDYLQLLEMGRRAENRQQEITQISRSLKQLARELSIPVVVLSQLSRAVQQREKKRPNMSDLRESGAIEQDADLVMLLYREDYYDENNEDLKGVAEVIVAKNRKGPVGSVKLSFQPERLRFANLSFSDAF
ncbi:MAG: replicative DNA helicase [Planctomycetota bacterium]